jgi:hypothetical protein
MVRAVLIAVSLITTPAAAKTYVKHQNSYQKVYAADYYKAGQDFQLQNTNS